jgi:hypothetical protein
LSRNNGGKEDPSLDRNKGTINGIDLEQEQRRIEEQRLNRNTDRMKGIVLRTKKERRTELE